MPLADDASERLKETEDRILLLMRLMTSAVTSSSQTDSDH